jgi:hypothetical protein
MNKPFALVETTDIEAYICDRLEVVAPATVDRELDVLSAICKTAIGCIARYPRCPRRSSPPGSRQTPLPL